MRMTVDQKSPFAALPLGFWDFSAVNKRWHFNQWAVGRDWPDLPEPWALARTVA